MDFALAPERAAFAAEIDRFAEQALSTLPTPRPGGAFSREGWQRLAGAGLHGLSVPVEHGGDGRDIVDGVLAMRALGRRCRESGLLFALSSHLWTCCRPISEFGSDAQKARYLPRLSRGTWIGGHALSEPGAGSDAFALRTVARRDGAGWVLDGEKAFVSNGPVAELLLIFAVTEPDAGWAGISGFLVEADAPGLVRCPPPDKLGLHSAPLCALRLEGCRVPGDALLGTPGQGFAIFDSEMSWERCCLFAALLGAMDRQLDDTVAHARSREQFGQPIGRFQAVSHPIADMRMRIVLAELILHKAAWQLARGERADLETAVAKLFISEGYVQSSLTALQVHGGRGYLRDAGIAGHLEDAVASTIYSGTSELLRSQIARTMGLR